MATFLPPIVELSGGSILRRSISVIPFSHQQKNPGSPNQHVLLLVLSKRMFEKADPFKAEQFYKMLLRRNICLPIIVRINLKQKYSD